MGNIDPPKADTVSIGEPVHIKSASYPSFTGGFQPEICAQQIVLSCDLDILFHPGNRDHGQAEGFSDRRVISQRLAARIAMRRQNI